MAIVTHSRLAAEAVVYGLAQMRDIHAVAAAATNVAATADCRVDVALLDADVPDSLSVAEALARSHPEAKLIVTNLDSRDGRVREFVTRGVAGFVLKDASPHELARTVRTVADGSTVLPAGLTASLFSRMRDGLHGSSAESHEPSPHFTRREWEVIDLVSAGLKTSEIGTRLNISCHTVKTHVCTILAKLALHSRLELSAWAHRHHDSADS